MFWIFAAGTIAAIGAMRVGALNVLVHFLSLGLSIAMLIILGGAGFVLWKRILSNEPSKHTIQ